MTKNNVMAIKLAIVSSLLGFITYLFIDLAKNGSPVESAIGQMGAFVVGFFGLISVISTLVFFLTTEEN